VLPEINGLSIAAVDAQSCQGQGRSFRVVRRLRIVGGSKILRVGWSVTPRLALHLACINAAKPQLDNSLSQSTGNQVFYDKAGSADKTLKIYQGHSHDFLNDLGKEVVMADIRSWVFAHVSAAKAAAPGS
jgi:alpha-beta hydrolase superfamily lysophospholipase